ncbi:unnamed protein product [Linum trigynum]|uniref:RNase H type-1 domain-containing protein n=1 Tax=Linum trigynum TaxID=586398 RepID=A0AAV2D7U0_9ROSI
MAVVAVLWRIWRSRNWVVFEGKQFGIPALMRQYNQQYEEWIGLPVDRCSPSLVLSPPQPAQEEATGLVCMWDGATRKGSHSAGGIVIMTPARGVLMAAGFQFPGIDDPLVVEVLVLREAVM